MKNVIVISVVAAIVAVISSVITVGLVGGNQPSLGSSGTRFPNGVSADSTSPSAGQVRATTLFSTGATTIGTGGTAISIALSGTCSPLVGASHTASTSATYTCKGLTGVLSTDRVVASLSRGTSNKSMIVSNARATTTTAFQFEVFNASGVATTTVDFLRSMNYLILR